jgi:hypothetical protein
MELKSKTRGKPSLTLHFSKHELIDALIFRSTAFYGENNN